MNSAEPEQVEPPQTPAQKESAGEQEGEERGDPTALQRAVLVAVAIGYGALAGGVAALTLRLMGLVGDIVWSVSDARWYIPVVIVAGGVLIAALRCVSSDVADLDIDGQLDQAHDPVAIERRSTLFLALSAIVAVAFGGAIGPEAGLLAVIAELSCLVAIRLGRTRAQQRALGDAGAAAALAGLYGSPPGAVAYGDDDLSPPKILTLLAAVAGFGGFLLVASLIFAEGLHGLALPEHTPAGNGVDLVAALLPALCGAAVGLGYAWVRPTVAAVLAKAPGPTARIMIGTVVFAALATAVPLARFSGHDDIGTLVEFAGSGDWLTLLGLALVKVVALALCLAAGWKGGEFFPLIFIGGAVGAALATLLPGLDLTVAMVAAMSAALTVAMRKPIAVLLLLTLMTGVSSLAAVFVGVAIGHLVSARLPTTATAHGGH